jgi:hypothetical protein
MVKLFLIKKCITNKINKVLKYNKRLKFNVKVSDKKNGNIWIKEIYIDKKNIYYVCSKCKEIQYNARIYSK